VDTRQCFASVEAWLSDGAFRSRITDGGESPWREHDVFADKTLVNLMDRDEAIAFKPGTDWTFRTVDRLMRDLQPCRPFLLQRSHP